MCYLLVLADKPCYNYDITICTTIHRCPILSRRYSVMCKVYTGYHGTSKTEHGLYACTVDNPLAKARGLSLRTGAQTILCIVPLTCTRTYLFRTTSEFARDTLQVMRLCVLHLLHQRFNQKSRRQNLLLKKKNLKIFGSSNIILKDYMTACGLSIYNVTYVSHCFLTL